MLGALGFLAMGRELAALGADRAWLEAHASMMDADQRIALARIREGLLAAYIGVIGLLLAARALRSLFERNRQALITISFPQCTVHVPHGWTVLEASRSFGLPHRAECGGRARCSTCRVRVINGADRCSPAGEAERRTLQRIQALPEVRLACQLRPEGDIAVVPLLNALSDTRRTHRSHKTPLRRRGYHG